MSQAIPSHYIGPWGRSAFCRSRTEGKWCIPLDLFGQDWTHEIQGYRFDDEVCYLPDFYIKSWNAYVEIKPRDKELTKAEKRKMFDMVQDGKRVLMICGTPQSFVLGDMTTRTKADLGICSTCYTFGLMYITGPHSQRVNRGEGHASEIELLGVDPTKAWIKYKPMLRGQHFRQKGALWEVRIKCPVCHMPTWFGHGAEWQRMTIIAESARFEFGEHGINWELVQWPKRKAG